MLGAYFRAAIIFAIAALLDVLMNKIGTPLLEIAAEGSLPDDAPPLVEWGQYFIDYFLLVVLLSLFIYLLVAAWRENKAPGGIQ